MALPNRTLRHIALLLCLGPCATFPQTPNAAPNPDLAAYILGPGDQISVSVEDLSEQFAGKTFRIDTDGAISLPVIPAACCNADER